MGKNDGINKVDLRFIYHDAEGNVSLRVVSNWTETAAYVEGYCLSAREIRTFRKDRILSFEAGCEALLIIPFVAPIPKSGKAKPCDTRTQILFTGFKKTLRDELEQKAKSNGMDVRANVTEDLRFLCIGPTAGPMKMEKARVQGVCILTEAQFHVLIETGELPDAE